MREMKLLLCAWLLLAACVDDRALRPAPRDPSLAGEDVERELLARVGRSLRADPRLDLPLEQLSLSLLDDADARYVLVEVRAPSGRLLLTYRIARATGAPE